MRYYGVESDMVRVHRALCRSGCIGGTGGGAQAQHLLRCHGGVSAQAVCAPVQALDQLMQML